MQNKSTPRRKRMKRKARLESAKQWIKDYSGKHIVKSYAKLYGVDLFCAVIELKQNGIQISEEYEKQIRQSIESKKNKKENKDQEQFEDFSDNQFVYIAGYTSNGVPFGITHEEMELIINKKIEASNQTE